MYCGEKAFVDHAFSVIKCITKFHWELLASYEVKSFTTHGHLNMECLLTAREEIMECMNLRFSKMT